MAEKKVEFDRYLGPGVKETTFGLASCKLQLVKMVRTSKVMGIPLIHMHRILEMDVELFPLLSGRVSRFPCLLGSLGGVVLDHSSGRPP